MKSAFWRLIAGVLIIGVVGALVGCVKEAATVPEALSVPHEERWGIYSLDLFTEKTSLIYSAAERLSGLRLSHSGDRFVFSTLVGGADSTFEEICTIGMDGGDFQQLTDNGFWDLYPCWSPDDTQIAFLSWRDDDLDIYVMNSGGGGEQLLYDSGGNDADIDWGNGIIAYTQDSQIWVINEDGSQPTQITDPPNAGEWGNANLPFGDYDPRISPDGTQIAFERLEDDQSIHGNYDIYVADLEDSTETQLTDTGYSQGLASWSHSGNQLVYLVAAIGDQGKYDIWMMNSNGNDNRNITPEYYPVEFLCHGPIFSADDTEVYFIGEWWE